MQGIHCEKYAKIGVGMDHCRRPAVRVCVFVEGGWEEGREVRKR